MTVAPSWSEADSGVVTVALASIDKALAQTQEAITRLSPHLSQRPVPTGINDHVAEAWSAACGALFSTVPRIAKMIEDIISVKLHEWQTIQQREIYTQDQLAGPLKSLQQWTERVADHILLAEKQLLSLGHPAAQVLPQWQLHSGQFHAMKDALQQCMERLVTRSCIFLTQPPQVLRTTVRFGTSVVCLPGKLLDLDRCHTNVTLEIVNEKRARELYSYTNTHGGIAIERKQLSSGSSGKILNGDKELVYDHTRDSFVAKFKSNLKCVKRTSVKSKQSDATVTEEKFCLVFHTQIKCMNGLTVSVCKMSRPLVVIVHGNQTLLARATMLWDSAFAEYQRIPFTVPNVISWVTLAPVLSNFFASHTGGQGLNGDQLEFIRRKLSKLGGFASAKLTSQPHLFDSGAAHSAKRLRTNMAGEHTHLREAHAPVDRVTWHALTKQTLPGRSFSLWEWLYGAAELVQKHLAEERRKGAVLSFIDRSDAQRLLLTQRDGSFIIRFSDSSVGAVSISYVGSKGGESERHVWHLEPWTSKDFSVRSLSDRIDDLDQLQLLYPDIPKRSVFKPTRSVHNSTDPEYTQSILRTVIPSLENLIIGTQKPSPCRAQQGQVVHRRQSNGKANTNATGLMIGTIRKSCDLEDLLSLPDMSRMHGGEVSFADLEDASLNTIASALAVTPGCADGLSAHSLQLPRAATTPSVGMTPPFQILDAWDGSMSSMSDDDVQTRC